MYPAHKNSYLQMATPIPPRVINRCVAKAMDNTVIDAFDAMPPFNRVTSHQPCIPIPNCDVTKRPIAFGRLAMPKLLREICSPDNCVIKQAITTLAELVHDPERNYEAIKLGLPSRMAALLEHPDAEVRERTLIALTTIGNLLDGKNAIVKNKTMLNNIRQCINDPTVEVRMQAFTLLETISLVWMVADEIVENGFIEVIVDLLQKRFEVEDSNVLVLMLQTVEHLMYCDGKTIAHDAGLFEVLMVILQKSCNPEVIGATLKVISILLQLEEVREKAQEAKLLKRHLYRYIMSESEVLYENAAAAMLFTTTKLKAMATAQKLPGLVDRLIELTKAVHQPSTQKYCMQILTNLTGHGKIKRYLLVEKIAELEAINVGNDEHGLRVKEILLVDSLKFG